MDDWFYSQIEAFVAKKSVFLNIYLRTDYERRRGKERI